MRPLVDAETIARKIGVAPRTIRAWARRELIPRHRPLAGRRYLFDPEEVLAALRALGREEVVRAS